MRLPYLTTKKDKNAHHDHVGEVGHIIPRLKCVLTINVTTLASPRLASYLNWSSVTPLPMALVELTPPVTIFCRSST